MGRKKKEEKEEIETLYDDVPKKKLHLERKFWLFVLLLFIGAGLAFGGTMFGIMKETKADNKETRETTKIKEDSVKEITDCEDVIKEGKYEETSGTIDRQTAVELDKKIEILTYTTDDLFESKAAIFEKNLKNSDLSDVIKLNSVLWYADNYYDEEDDEDYTAYSYDDINKLFKSVYGYNIKETKSSIKDLEFKYDKSSKKFMYKIDVEDEDDEEYEDDDEEYEGDSYFDYYTYKYEVNDKNAYVYLSLGYFDDTNEDYTLVYKDYYKKELYKKMTNEEFEDFYVDRFNYNDFSKYKITFTKSGTDYVFDSIELLK